MATLDQLIEQALQELLSGGSAGLEDKLYATAEQDINRRSGDTARTILENTFGRGMGNSSITRDLNSERERVRAEALIRARSESASAGRQAILAALAQGAGQQRARQQESQFGRNLAFNEKSRRQAKDIAEGNQLTQGIGGLAGAALQTGGLIYGPEIKNFLRGGLNPASLGPGMSRVTGQLGGDLGVVPSSLDALASAGDVPDFSIPDFELPDVGGSFDAGNFDFEGDFNFGFDPSLDFGSTLDLLARMPDWENF